MASPHRKLKTHTTEKAWILQRLHLTAFFTMETSFTHKRVRLSPNCLFSGTPWCKPFTYSSSSVKRLSDISKDLCFKVFIYCLEYFILNSFGTSLNTNNFLPSITIIVTYSVHMYVRYCTVYHTVYHSAVVVFGHFKTCPLIHKCTY